MYIRAPPQPNSSSPPVLMYTAVLTVPIMFRLTDPVTPARIRKRKKKSQFFFLVAKDDPLLIWVLIFESLHSIPPPRKCLKMEMFFNSHTSKSLQRLVAPTRELHDHENNSTEEGASPAPLTHGSTNEDVLHL